MKIHKLGHGKISGALVGAGVGREASGRVASLIIGAAQGVFSASLWMPFGFKERHPIWGTLFGVGAAFNLVNAATDLGA
jgi:hypothetical protein